MRKGGRAGVIALGLALVGIGAGSYVMWTSEAATIVGIVRTTEIRVAPEVGGQLVPIKVQKGSPVHTGDVVAELSALELTAAVAQARATLNAAIASRDHIYAGVRAEQIAALAAEVAKAESRLKYAQAQLGRTTYLAGGDVAAKQALDQAESDAATAGADIAEARSNYAAAQAGPTNEERAIADAQVREAMAALAVLERRLQKTILTAPADGVVSVIVAEIGENIREGQPVLVIAETGKQWLSFNVREDRLQGLTVGEKVRFAQAGKNEPMQGLVTALTPLGAFATWQAERAIGAHDRNTLRLRVDPQGDPTGLDAGTTVWLDR